MVELKSRLNEAQVKYKAVEAIAKQKDLKIEELKETCIKKDKEMNDLKNKLTEKLQKCQLQEEKYKEQSCKLECELLQLKKELEAKTTKLNELKKNVKDMTSSKCIQLSCAQDEILLLKNEVSRLMKRHNQLNAEVRRINHSSLKTLNNFISRTKN